MSRLVLVRHASTAWTGRRYCGRADPPLDDRGRAEAEGAAEAVVGLVDRGTTVNTSPLIRARATAAVVAARIGSTVDVDARLAELDVGAVEGLAFAELEARWPELARRLLAPEIDIDWPDGESAAHARVRVASVVATWRAGAGDLVVVSHAGFLALMREALTGSGSAPIPPGGVVVLDLARSTDALAAGVAAVESRG